jgi:primase-polymerase (primpol)-like protein
LPAALAPLQRRDRWVAWRFREGKKIPYQPLHPGKLASTADATKWGTYTQAVHAARRINGGVGFVIGDGIGAFDLDQCRHPDKGWLVRWARDLIDKSRSYAEVTPSGTGARIIGKASGGEVHRVITQQPGKVEVYRDCHRYITITGDAITDVVCLANIDALIDELVPARERKHADVVIERVSEDARAIVRRYDRSLHKYFDEPIPKGIRSDVICKIVWTLRDRGATPGEAMNVLRATRCWRDKWGDNETALTQEVQRLFSKG